MVYLTLLRKETCTPFQSGWSVKLEEFLYWLDANSFLPLEFVIGKMGPLANMSPTIPSQSALSKMSPYHHLSDMQQKIQKSAKPYFIICFTGDFFDCLILPLPSLVGGWTNPSEKYEPNWIHLPNFWGKNSNKYWSCHHLVVCLILPLPYSIACNY